MCLFFLVCFRQEQLEDPEPQKEVEGTDPSGRKSQREPRVTPGAVKEAVSRYQGGKLMQKALTHFTPNRSVQKRLGKLSQLGCVACATCVISHTWLVIGTQNK